MPCKYSGTEAGISLAEGACPRSLSKRAAAFCRLTRSRTAEFGDWGTKAEGSRPLNLSNKAVASSGGTEISPRPNLSASSRSADVTP